MLPIKELRKLDEPQPRLTGSQKRKEGSTQQNEPKLGRSGRIA
jgi:hypothetical protein